MRFFRSGRLAVFALLTLLTLAAGGARAMGERVSATDIPGTMKVDGRSFPTAVLASDVPVLVFFTANWCPYCRKTAPELAKLAQNFGSGLSIAVVDYDENEDLVADYGVRGIPALLLFKNGSLTARTSGAKTVDQLRRFVLNNIGSSYKNNAPDGVTVAQ